MRKGTMRKLALALAAVLLTTSVPGTFIAAEGTDELTVQAAEETALLVSDEVFTEGAGEIALPDSDGAVFEEDGNDVVDFEDPDLVELPAEDQEEPQLSADGFEDEEALADPEAGEDDLLLINDEDLAGEEPDEEEGTEEAPAEEEVLEEGAEDMLGEEMTEADVLLQAGPTKQQLNGLLRFDYDKISGPIPFNKALYIDEAKGDLNLYVSQQALNELYTGQTAKKVKFLYFTKAGKASEASVGDVMDHESTTPNTDGYFNDYVRKDAIAADFDSGYQIAYFRYRVTYENGEEYLSDYFPIRERGAYGNDYYTSGQNVTWEYDPLTNVMTFSGSGEMTENDDSSDTSLPYAGLVTRKYLNNEKILPKVVIQKGITSIAPHMFLNTGVTDLTMPDTLTKIGQGAFRFSALKNLVIPALVTEVGEYAFGSDYLESITLPAKLKEIPASCFDNAERLKSVTIPDGVTKIGESAFKNCYSLASIKLPAQLKEIGEDAFADCVALKSITIPEHVTKIGAGAFSGCNVLEKVTLPKDLKEIGEFAFWASPKLQEVIIPEGTTTIGRKAFFGCAGLKKIVIPASVKTIGEDVFKDANKDLVIVTTDGSAAAAYAKSHGVKLVVDQLAKLEKTILAKKNTSNVSGAVFSKLKARATQVGPKFVQLKWTKVKGASYNIYGALRTGTFKKIATVAKGKNTYKHTGLKKNKFYKYIVVAYDASSDAKTIKSTSATVIVPTAGGTYRKISAVNINKGNSTIKKNKSLKIKGTAKASTSSGKRLKVYRTVRYESGNKNIATVGAKGKITGKKKGSCYIYAYAQDGTFKRIKITVK